MSQRLWVCAFALSVLFATTVHAQCTIGVYQDPGGRSGGLMLPPNELEEFSVYVVLLTSDSANAAAYQLDVSSQLGTSLFLANAYYGPSAKGIGLIRPPGGSAARDAVSVGLGECAGGSGGVLVTDYRFFRTASFVKSKLGVLPNLFESPSYPVYATCEGVVRDCPQTVALLIEDVPIEPKSVGEVKSLYNQ